MIRFIHTLSVILILGLVCGMMSCQKNLVSDTITPPGELNTTNSSIRLFNVFGFPLDVTVNNIPLTSYSASNSTGVGKGLSIFPTGVWNDATSFTIPNTLLDKNGNAHISIQPRVVYSGASPIPLPVDTILANSPLQPVDYYILSDGHYHPLSRSAAVPSQPMNFKIRVINWSSVQDTSMLTGPMSVTYADGSAVDPKLTNIGNGQITDYVELPYGSIEFKVFANQDFTKQLTQLPIKPNFSGYNDKPVYDQEARFGPTTVFKPGGVYTLFISSNIIDYTDGYCYVNYYVPVNSYRVIAENSPSVNTTFARLQGVNAYPVAGSLSLKIDGQPLGAALGYSQHTDYNVLVQGLHTVEADDQSGNVVAQKKITLYPYDNITAWVYQRDSVPDICFSPMDMSQVQTGLLFDCLNLCSGIPYLTFTNDAYPFYSTYYYTSNDPDTASTNVALGQQVLFDPYIFNDLTPGRNAACGQQILQPGTSFGVIRAYQSDIGPPVQVPGSYLDNVAPIHSSDFVANPSLYSSPPGPAEPGAYTIALIGRMGADGPDPFAPRILILKHSK